MPPSATKPGCARPSSASRPRSRTSTSAPHVASTRPCSSASPTAAGSLPGAHRRSDRQRQDMAGLRPRPQSLPREPRSPLCPPAAPRRRSGAGPRRRSLSQAHGSPRPGQAAHSRRWGLGTNELRRATRSAGDRRRPPRSHRHLDHQPVPGRPLARSHRRADPRRLPSSTASSTTPIASSSKANPCASDAPRAPSLDRATCLMQPTGHPAAMKTHPLADPPKGGRGGLDQLVAFSWNRWSRSPGTAGRHRWNVQSTAAMA